MSTYQHGSSPAAVDQQRFLQQHVLLTCTSMHQPTPKYGRAAAVASACASTLVNYIPNFCSVQEPLVHRARRYLQRLECLLRFIHPSTAWR